MIKSPVAELASNEMPWFRDRNISKAKRDQYFEAWCFVLDSPKMQTYELYPLVLHFCDMNHVWGHPKHWPAGTLYCPDCGENLK